MLRARDKAKVSEGDDAILHLSKGTAELSMCKEGARQSARVLLPTCCDVPIASARDMLDSVRTRLRNAAQARY